MHLCDWKCAGHFLRGPQVCSYLWGFAARRLFLAHLSYSWKHLQYDDFIQIFRPHIPRSSFLWFLCNVLKRKQCLVTSTICRAPGTLTVISCYREVFPYNYTFLLQVSVLFSAVLCGRCLLTGNFWRYCPAGVWKKWTLRVTTRSFRLFSTQFPAY